MTMAITAIAFFLYQAAVSPEHQLTFQLKFAKLRSMIFLAHSHLIMVCRQMQICPPPETDESQQTTAGSAVNGLRTQVRFRKLR